MKKNIVALMLALVLVFSLTACASDNTDDTVNNGTTGNTDTNTDNNTNTDDTTTPDTDNTDDTNTPDTDDTTGSDDTTTPDTDDTTGSDDTTTPDTDDTATPDDNTDAPEDNTGADDTTDAPELGNPNDMTLAEIMAFITDVDLEKPMLGEIELNAENFEAFAFIPAQEGLEGYVSEPMMSSIAHSVVLLRAPDAATAEDVAERVEANHNPMKWCCVEAEKVEIVVHDTTVLLVMSFTDMADAIVANFDSLWA